MYKYKHKKGGGIGGICVLCPNLIARWEKRERLQHRAMLKRVKRRVDSTRMRHSSHSI